MSKQKQLDELKSKMLSDDSLPLKDGATNLVFGDGSCDAEILFIGEGPGYWEDQKALPFVGQAGALLNQLLATIKIPREDVFITNVLHYRPPNNRDPLPEEIEAFKPYLDRIIEIIKPKMIITLGRFSMAKFIPGVTITNVHGKPRKVEWKASGSATGPEGEPPARRGRTIVVMPMYHPAAALRSSEIKRRTFDDFAKIPEVLSGIDQVKKEEIEVDKVEKVEQMKLV